MKELELRNQELWYTDNPVRGNIDEIRSMNGTLRLPSIIVYTSEGFVSHREGSIQRYAIVEGNKRAFVDAENGRRTKAKLLETDEDLDLIFDELDPGHVVIRSGINSLEALEHSLHTWLQARFRNREALSYGPDVD